MESLKPAARFCGVAELAPVDISKLLEASVFSSQLFLSVLEHPFGPWVTDGKEKGKERVFGLEGFMRCTGGGMRKGLWAAQVEK
ncbi:hypothetical protein Droror1_Dr00027356 [Drosera rotundifolia]